MFHTFFNIVITFMRDKYKPPHEFVIDEINDPD